LYYKLTSSLSFFTFSPFYNVLHNDDPHNAALLRFITI